MDEPDVAVPASMPVLAGSPPPQPPDLDEEATQAIAQGMEMVAATQFGVAAFLFRKASQLIEANGGDLTSELGAEYYRAEGDSCEAFDLARNGNRAKSLEFASIAVNRFHAILKLVDKLPAEGRENARAGMVVELNSLQMFKAVTEMMKDILEEDFDTAIDTAARVKISLEENRTTVAGLNIPEAVKTSVGDGLGAVAVAIDGLRAYAEASQAVSTRKWDASTKSFGDAKKLLRDAGDAYSRVPRLASQSQVWPMMVDTLVEPARKRAKQLREMLENFDQFKEGMVRLAHAVGANEITLNNVVNSTQQIQNQIDVRITLVNEFEDRTRDALTKLRDAIKDAPVDEKVRKEMLDKIETVSKAPKHDSGFFDKFKKFIGDSAGIVENIAKVAGPVATAWNLFAPFYGLPVIPVPVKMK